MKNSLLFLSLLLCCSLTHAKKVYPLRLSSGRSITTVKSWLQKREDIKKILQRDMYGYRPESPLKSYELVKDINIDEENLNYKEYLIHFIDQRITRNIRLALFSPIAQKPKGIFLTINRCGNHTLYKRDVVTIDPTIEVHPDCYKKDQLQRGSRDFKISAQKVVKRGYSVGTIAEGYMDADDPTKTDDGISAELIPSQSRNPVSMGHLMAWSWGLSQVIDLFKSESFAYSSDIPVIVIGHSRRGKAALLTGAFDERVDITIAHQSGMGGTARIRGAYFPFRESAHFMFNKHSIVYKFVGDPHGLGHFFNGAFKELSKKPNKLEFDAHFLTSLVAPRFLLDVQGTKDRWAGPKSAWTTIRKTFPVYQLYNLQTPSESIDLEDATELDNFFPIMQVKRKTKHEIEGNYWELFLNYADKATKNLKKTPAPTV